MTFLKIILSYHLPNQTSFSFLSACKRNKIFSYRGNSSQNVTFCLTLELKPSAEWFFFVKTGPRMHDSTGVEANFVPVDLLATPIPRRKLHKISSSECFEAACPESWIGFQRKCFYFSDDIKNWTFSQRFCDSYGADLVQIETLLELNFLLRYKGPYDHWIGLSRDLGQPWKWVNGTEWTNCFPIRGGGECAYLNDKGASSARRYTERKWICSKPDIYAQIKRQNSI
uniref:C-type lectin domain family 2 member D n=1 Tax=Canis lupus familiaris TaxID=9615 RepID=A0A8P0NQS6_CANLF